MLVTANVAFGPLAVMVIVVVEVVMVMAVEVVVAPKVRAVMQMRLSKHQQLHRALQIPSWLQSGPDLSTPENRCQGSTQRR